MASEWDLTVSSKYKLLDIKPRELVRSRDLIFMFCLRDFTTIYKQTILGPLRYIISPFCSTIVFAFVFGGMRGIGTDGIPKLLFYYGGTILWSYFASCLNNASGIFLANAAVFGKVYFPRLTMPLAVTFSTVLKMLLQFVILMMLLAYYVLNGNPVRPTAYASLFPLLIIWLGALGTGYGMIVSALTTRYHDLNHVLGLALQLAMYITPVIYPLSLVPEKFKLFFIRAEGFNTSPFRAFKKVLNPDCNTL